MIDAPRGQDEARSMHRNRNRWRSLHLTKMERCNDYDYDKARAAVIQEILSFAGRCWEDITPRTKDGFAKVDMKIYIQPSATTYGA